jgi:hypothetical protein
MDREIKFKPKSLVHHSGRQKNDKTRVSGVIWLGDRSMGTTVASLTEVSTEYDRRCRLWCD